MFDVIHTLATQYGWSKNVILNEMYYDEIEYYFKRIKKERASDNLTELAIVQNPHTKDPKELSKKFQNQIEESEGKSYLMKEEMTNTDETNLRELARRMKENSEQRRKG